MGERLNTNLILIAICGSVLSMGIASHFSRIHSARIDARMVQVQPRYDASVSVGIPQPSVTDNSINSKSVPKYEEATLTQLENTQMIVKKILAFEEGFRSRPYICSAGYITIGYGTKLHKRKGMNPNNFPLTINEAAATEMLNDDLTETINALQRSKQGAVFNNLSQTRKNLIISMAYQLGVTGVLKFKKTWKFLAAEMYSEAATEMLDSKWFLDTPERAKRHSVVMAVDNMNNYRIYF
jgi:lysozyme